MEEKKKRKRKISASERKRRSENMKEVGLKRAAEVKAKREEELALLKKEMPIKDKAFAELYVWGDSKFQGNPGACYKEIFGVATMAEAGRHGRKLVAKEHVSEEIAKQMEEYEILIKAEKIKNIRTLTKIRDEMSEAQYVNRFGEINGVAACRSVAIKAAETVNNMLGFDKPKEVNVNHGAGDQGIVFNLVVPQIENGDKDEVIDITHEEVNE